MSSAATTGGSGVAKAFRGAIIHSKGLGNLECLVDGLITVGIDGIILDLVDLSQCANAAEKVRCETLCAQPSAP